MGKNLNMTRKKTTADKLVPGELILLRLLSFGNTSAASRSRLVFPLVSSDRGRRTSSAPATRLLHLLHLLIVASSILLPAGVQELVPADIMCDCFHIAFPNWHAASSGAGAGRRLRGPEPGTEDDSIRDEADQFTEGERPRPQGSSPVEEFLESDKYGDSDKECDAEHDPHRKGGKKGKKSGLGSIFDKRSTPKMSKLKGPPSPEAGVIVKTAKDGGAEGLVYGGGGKDGIFIKEVVPESPAFKNLHLKQGDQVLSATVYFDDIPYEDAVQILEHAQAYKLKLCLKRKPEITETEAAIDSDVIPEDEIHQPEMREPGKKRRGEARISWPKFPTLGRGKKSRFRRSHSSSEADEQRKLELSPTTSDTESPIKTQDALKGKKKHKIKLPGLKRGRISSSEDTDAQNVQTEDMISPECLDSPSKETQDAEEEPEKAKDVKVEESETETHKTELVCLDSTLKTTDITRALAEEEIVSAAVPPDGKKKKKERSELKLKILGRDKKTKAKSSPKRLKTLGASLDKTEKEHEKTEVVPPENVMDTEVPKMSSSKSSQMQFPKVEIDISDVGIMCKSNEKKGKGAEEKQAKTGFKLPKVGLSDVATEEIMKIDVCVDGSKTKDKDDAYEKFLKGAEFPNREDIEIPGMEDVSKVTKDFKEQRAPLATLSDAETVQMSIDVKSVKEAVSKLPGYKLPKVDMSGVPIPEEITVIDANAQRISVKTPTKGKHDSKSVFTEMSKTTIKLPNVTADASGGEMMSETKVGVKKLELDSKDVISTKAIISQTIEVEKVQKENITFSCESMETSKELDIRMKTPKVALPDFSKPDAKMSDFRMDLTKKKDQKVQGERTIFLPGDKTDVKVSDVKILPVKAEFEIPSKDIDLKLKLEHEEKVKGEVSVGGVEITRPEKQEKGGKFKMPTVSITMPKVKGGKVPEVDVDVGETVPEVQKLEFKSQQTDIAKEATFGIKLKSPEVRLTKKDNDVTPPEKTIELPELALKMPQMKAPELDVSVSNDVDVTLPDVNAKVEIPEVPTAEVSLGAVEVSIPEQKVDVKAPSIDANFEGQGGKFKMPKLGVKLPKVKGPEFDIRFSKKDRNAELPKGKVEESSVSSPEKKIDVKNEGEVDGRDGKFKMPKLGITMPKMKGPEIDLNFSKKDVETTLPEVQADIKVSNDLKLDDTAKVDISIPKIDDVKLKADADPSLSVKVTAGETDANLGKFQMPKFGISMPKVKAPEIDLKLSKEEKDVKPTEVKVSGVDITVGKVDVPEGRFEMGKQKVEIKPFEAKLDIKKPKVKTQEPHVGEVEGQSGKFKIPRFTIDIPNVKGPETDSSLRKEIDVALPEAKIKVECPDAPKHDVEIKPLEMDVDIGGQSGKFKLPKFGIKMPNLKEPDIAISLPKKEVPSPVVKVDLKVPEVPKVDASLEKVDVEIEVEKPSVPHVEVKPPSGKIKIKAPDIDVSVTEDSQSKFKMPSLGISVPKMKTPEVGLSLSKKDADVTLPDANVEVVLPEISGKTDVNAPEGQVSTRGSPLKFKMPSFKLPKFGGSIEKKDSEIKMEEADLTISAPQLDVDLPDVSAAVHLPEAEALSGEVVIEQPSGLEMDAKFKKPRFSLSRFSFSKQSGPAPEVDIHVPEVNVPLPEGEMEVKGEIDVKSTEPDVQVDGQGGKFKLPKFGISMPKISAPEIDLSVSKSDEHAKVKGKLPDAEMIATSVEVDVKSPEIKVETKTKEGSPSKLKMPTFKLPKLGVSIPEANVTVSEPQLDVDLPDVKAEIHIPDVEVKAPSGKVVIEQPPGLEMDAKFKKPRFSLPRFSFSKQSVPAPEVDVNAPEVNIAQPENIMEVKGEIDVKSPELDVQIDGQGSKFKLPKFGISMPTMSAPEIDLSISKKDKELTLPEVEVEGKLPDVDIKVPSIEAEFQAPEIKVETKTKEGSPSKLKMPTFKFPKFGASIPEAEIKVEGPNVSRVDVDLPEIETKINLPEVEVKAPSVEVEIEPSGLEMDAKFKKPRFSMPRFSFSKQSVPHPEVDINAPEVNIPQPEGKVEVEGELDLKAPELEAQIDGQGSKFKLPKFGISMPTMSAPEIDLSISKRDKELTLPEVEVEGKLPDVDIKVPSIEAEFQAPEIKVETKTKEGSPSKLKMPTFKFPKFGASIPEAEIKVDRPNVTKVDVDLPEIETKIDLPEAEVKVPSVAVEIEPPGLEMDAKFKKPRFSMPRFSFSKQSVPHPEVDISAPEVNIPQPEGKVEVEGQLDFKAPELEAQIDKQGSKFKLPKFGISMPTMSAPEIDLSISKRDKELTLPEVEVEGKLPDVDIKVRSIEAEFQAPEIEVETKTKEGSPSKLKMPIFKFPKFGASIPEAEIKVDGPNVTKVDVDLPEIETKINLPEVEVKAPSVEVEIEPSGLEMDAKFKKPRFSMPWFSFSKQSVPHPEVDISAPEVDIPQPEGKVEVEGELDLKAPELEAQIDKQGSKFKLPKFGISMPTMSAPEIDLSISTRDKELTLPEVEGQLPDVDIKVPSIEAEFQAPEIKVETKTKEGSPSKLKMPTFKFPKFGASIPEAEIKVDGPNVTKVDVDLPEIETKINLPEVEVKASSVEVEIEPSGLEMDAKFKKPRFSMPRFSFSKQSVPHPEVNINAPEVNIPQPEGKVEVEGELDLKAPELEAQIDGQGSKFKLPKFGISMPKMSAPEIDLSISKSDKELTLPEVEVEGKLPDVDIKVPSIEAEFQAPEIKVETKTKEGSPSKLKMPTFKFPKFGASIPEAEIKVEGPNVSRVDVDLPEIETKINLPEVEVKAPSVEVEIEPSGLEMDAKFKKPRFSMPRFSFSKQSVPHPEVDINAPDVNIPQPEGKVEMEGELDLKAPELESQIDGQGSKFKLPKFGISMPKMSAPEVDLNLSKKDAEVTLPELETKVPDVEIKLETKTKEGSPSKLKMPTFKLPKFGVSIPEAEIHVDGPDVTTEVPQIDVDVPDVKAEVHIAEPEMKVPSGEVVIEQPSALEIDAKFKKPRFSLPRFSFSKQSVQTTEVDVSAPEVDIPQTEGNIEMKGKMDVKSPELDVQVDAQGSKFKLPKFGISMPKMSAPELDLSLSNKDAEVTLPEAKLEARVSGVEVKAPAIEAEIKVPELKVDAKTKERSPSKLKMPTFKLPKFGASIPETEIKVGEGTVDADIPDVNVEIDLPETEVKAPAGEVVLEQPSGLEFDAKFKKPRFSLPRFSFSKQSVPAPEVDISAPDANIPLEGKVEVKTEIDVKSPEFEAQLDGQGSMFKFPKFGFSAPKTSATELDQSLAEMKVEGQVPGVELKGTSVEVEMESSGKKVESKQTDGSPSKLKMPSFKMPKFGLTTSSISADGADIKTNIPEENPIVQTESSSVDIKVSEPELKRSKFKLPSLGFSTTGTDASLEKDMQLPDVEFKDSPAKVDIKVSGLEESNVEGSPSKFKMPSFKLPKFGATAQMDGEAPDVDTDINVDLKVSKKDVEGEKPEAKEESKAGWSLPRISFSKSSGAASEMDVSASESRKGVQSPDGTQALVLTVEGQPTSEIDVKMKKPRFSLPKISFAKQPSVESDAEVDVSSPGGTAEVKQADGDQKIEREVDARGSKFKMPHFGISMTKVKGPEVDVSISKKEAKSDVSETKAPIKVEESPTKFKMPTLKLPKLGLSVEASDKDNNLKHDGSDVESTTIASTEGKEVQKEPTGAKFNFGISMPKVKGPDIDVSLSKKDRDINSPDAKESPVPEAEENELSLDAKQKGASWSFPSFSFSKPGVNVTHESDVEVKADVKEALVLEAKGSPVAAEDSPAAEPEMKAKFSLPRFSFSKTPKEPITLPDTVSLEVSLSEGEVKIKAPKDATVEVNAPEDDPEDSIKTPDPQAETQSSPSKFKLPSFKMPRLSFSKSTPDDENTQVDNDQLERFSKEEIKSPKKALPSLGDILKNIDVEFDVPSQLEENMENKTQEAQEQRETLKQEAKSPERTGWFKFPTFGLTSPMDAAKSGIKEDKKSLVDLTGDDDLSPTCSIQSSEAFGDISSTFTSENVGFSSSSPTKVTVKYSDPDSTVLTRESRSNVVTSTTKTEMICVEPDLPEKITLVSSGLSSSSEDTIQLTSGKIHIISSNIQAAPESQTAKMLTSVHVQSAEGVSGLESWTVTESRSSRSTFTARESSSKDVVITKQITRMVQSTEPISDETATSIKQLKDSVHTDKMRFFDEAEK
ncbi:uncharacterized protein [Eucyclogobius newberryi]|uniref:uncharacterized protein n=1 Tax=Eucyclogobius newberryi TaxID=166745 RepID=UPI003B58DEFF